MLRPGHERTIRAGGVELATQAFGDPADPPVLLIMGAMASMLWWPEGFCRALAERGHYVIRYDNRDTGLSTAGPPGAPGYTLDDMADDAVRVLDGYGIAAAHVAGMSMGGGIAQLAALKHPSRTATLTAISSSPFGEDTAHLPGVTAAYRAHAATFEHVDWSDPAQVVPAMVADARMIAGTAHPFDEARAHALIERDIARARNFASATNHFLLRGGDAWKGRLREIAAPTLVVHGTADPIFPFEHGEALAATVAGATLLRIDGGGHELHPEDWRAIVGAIAAHTDR